MSRRASVVLLFILCGCAEPSRQSDQGQASTADSISNAATTQALEVEEEFRIGEVEGVWEKQFQHIRGVALDRNGLIYVANGMPSEIRVFKTDGSFVRRFGKPGGGPGEFRQITAMRLMRDTLLIEDVGSGRFTTYTPDGRYVRSFVQYIKPHFVQTLGFYDGAYIAQRWPPTKRERREGQVYQDSAQVVALDSAGRKIVRDIVKYPNRRAVGTKWAARGGESGADWPLFDPIPHAAMDDSGRIYISEGAPFRVQVFGTNGARLRAITREHKPVAIKDDDVTAYISTVKSIALPPHLRAITTSSQFKFQMERHDERARLRQVQSFPPIARVLVTASGGMWVERGDLHGNGVRRELRSIIPNNDFADGPTAWDVFDASGQYRGSVTMPPRFYAYGVTEDQIVGVGRDDMDVEFVVGYRIVSQNR